MDFDSDLTVLTRAEVDSSPAVLDIRKVTVTDSGLVTFFEPSFSEDLPDWLRLIAFENFEIEGISSLAGLEEEREEFSQEKLFFETLTVEQLRPYRDTYVAIHGQAVVDSDRDLYALTNRFFSQHGHIPVYIAFIGKKPRHFIPGPIIF